MHINFGKPLSYILFSGLFLNAVASAQSPRPGVTNSLQNSRIESLMNNLSRSNLALNKKWLPVYNLSKSGSKFPLTDSIFSACDFRLRILRHNASAVPESVSELILPVIKKQRLIKIQDGVAYPNYTFEFNHTSGASAISVNSDNSAYACKDIKFCFAEHSFPLSDVYFRVGAYRPAVGNSMTEAVLSISGYPSESSKLSYELDFSAKNEEGPVTSVVLERNCN